MMQAYLLAISGVLLNCFAQLFLKAGTNQAGVISAHWDSAYKVLSTPIFYAGFACYGLSLIVWIMALSKLPVSVAYPLLSIAYVLNMVLAYYLFQEPITLLKVIGTALILLGVVLISQS
ncbi:MAG: hypothetical protein RLZZ502_1267 [Pseudomonadota bacterium]|jgi:multidrug transporter EmrE-like cation transporter